jgi:hypothetical protein
MLFGVPGLKRTLSSIAVLILAGVSFVSCGGYSSPKTSASGFGFRAFVSNPLHPAGGGVFPVLSIVDAAKDSYTGFSVDMSGTSTFPGMMALTPNLKDTLVFSSTGNTIAVADNAAEAIAQTSGSTPIPAIPLLGPTESMLAWIDSETAFAAVPAAPVAGHPTGAVEVLAFLSGSTSPEAVIPVASAHYLVQSHDGNSILVFSDNPQNTSDSPPECPTAQCITLISPSLLGSEPRTAIGSSTFDHPVWGVFSGDDATAYIFNCGPQCGGTTASISVLDFSQTPPTVTSTIPVPAATRGILSGTTLYVAGMPAGVACPSGLADTACGELTTIDTGSLTVTGSFTISGGYHDHVVMGANGQLFIGASTLCNSCLSIFNTASSAVVFPTDTGYLTGIEPITDRSVVYICQGGRLRIYDTTTDQLQTLQVVIVGQAIDVKLVDPPGNFN